MKILIGDDNVLIETDNIIAVYDGQKGCGNYSPSTWRESLIILLSNTNGEPIKVEVWKSVTEYGRNWVNEKTKLNDILKPVKI